MIKIMAKTIAIALVIASLIVLITAQKNVCFDDKQHLENLSESQMECKKFPENEQSESKMVICVMKNLGILKENEDSFDFAKTKNYILSKIEDASKKARFEKEIDDCAVANPTGDLGYYSCFVTSFREICYQ